MSHLIANPEIIASTKSNQLTGGLALPENKSISTVRGICKLDIPSELVLPLQQHLGKAAESLVNVGDKILKGQQIAKESTETAISASLHAPTSGEITAIEPRIISHPSGLQAMCIVIKPDGQDLWDDNIQGLSQEQQQSAELIYDKIKQAGIVGLGGAGFPTAAKIAKNKIDTLIINAAECEPYITADDMLMRTYPHEVIKGIILLMRVLQANNCIIGIEDNKPIAIAALQQALKASNEKLAQKIQLRIIASIYPSGSEKQLINIVTGKEVTSGKLPADLGIIMQNVATARAVCNAVIKGEPLISRITTLTGNALERPVNADILLGTKLQDALQSAGLQQDRLAKIIIGGPMMGFTVSSLEIPLIKTSNCVIAGSALEFPLLPDPEECIRCGYCADVCPSSLLPQQLLAHAKTQDEQKLINNNLFDCIECGLCAYVCPAHIPLVNYYRNAKQNIRNSRQQQAKSALSKQRFEKRSQRLAAIKQQREQQRQQAAAKRKQAAASKTEDPIQAALARVMAKKHADNKNTNSQATATHSSASKINIRLQIANKALKTEQDKLLVSQQKKLDSNKIEANIALIEQQISSLTKEQLQINSSQSVD